MQIKINCKIALITALLNQPKTKKKFIIEIMLNKIYTRCLFFSYCNPKYSFSTIFNDLQT